VLYGAIVAYFGLKLIRYLTQREDKNMMKKIATLVVATALTLTLAVAAQASLLSLDVTGSLDGATVLTTPGGSAPLGTDTPFSYHAIFDSTGGSEIISGTGLYQYTAATTFALAGYGTYASSSLFVTLADPSSAFGKYMVGILADFSNNILIQYGTASPPFSGGAPTPSVLSNFATNGFNGALTFDGGVTLSNLTDVIGSIPTAAITTAAAVPEPSTYVLLTIALGAVGFVRRKMNQQM
jgi:hypothetical protein